MVRVFFEPWGQDQSQKAPWWKWLILQGKTITAIHDPLQCVAALSVARWQPPAQVEIEALSQCCFKVVPASETLAQH